MGLAHHCLNLSFNFYIIPEIRQDTPDFWEQGGPSCTQHTHSARYTDKRNPMFEVANCDLKESTIIMAKPATALAKSVESKLHVLREHKVILDADLAELYRVPVND